jgi:hypothetical protein
MRAEAPACPAARADQVGDAGRAGEKRVEIQPPQGRHRRHPPAQDRPFELREDVVVELVEGLALVPRDEDGVRVALELVDVDVVRAPFAERPVDVRMRAFCLRDLWSSTNP